MNVGPVIVSQFCESMIRMSRCSLLVLVLAGALAGLVGGCCGGAPSHKCDFSGLPSQEDSGTDGPIPCATLGPCMGGTVCCLTKIAPYAECIDPKNFQSYGCETKPPPMPTCTKPSDCTGGNVCCVEALSGMVACQPTSLCPGNDGTTYIICQSDSDCPSKASGSCQAYDAGAAAQVSFCM